MATLTLTAAANAAAQFLGALDSGNTLSAQQVADALAAANQLIDNWSNDRLMAETVNLESILTTSGTISYALATRRAAVEAASIKTPAPSMPLRVVNAKEWSLIPDRGVAKSFPRILAQIAADRPDVFALMQAQAFPTDPQLSLLIRLLLDRSGTSNDALAVELATSGIGNATPLVKLARLPSQAPAPPVDWQMIYAAQNSQPAYLFYDRGLTTGTVYLAGPPQTGTMELLTWTALTGFVDATTPRTMEPGYQRMFELALAIELAPQYDLPVTKELAGNFADAMARVRQLNASLLGMAPATEAASTGQVTPAAGGS